MAESLFHLLPPLILAGALGGSLHAVPDLPRPSLLFLCPAAPGICQLQDSTAVPLELPLPSSAVVDFFQTPDRRMAVLVRGHQDPGTVFVLDERRQVIVRRRLGQPAPLAAIAGLGPGGTLVLCGSSPAGATCDVELAGEGSGGAIADFPSDCLFPSVLPTGESACLRQQGDAPSIRVRTRLGRVTEKTLFSVNGLVGGLALQSDTEAIALLTQQLIRWSQSSAEALSSGLVLWLQRTGDSVLFGECDATDEAELHRCSVKVYRAGDKPVVLWNDPGLIPTHAAVQPDGAIAIVLAQGEKFRLLLLQEKSGRWTTQQIDLRQR